MPTRWNAIRDMRRTALRAYVGFPLALFAIQCISIFVIRSFADSTTEKLFHGEELTRKEFARLGSLNPVKAFERLAILNEADEKALLLMPTLHYHKLKGTSKYSIDADSRKSPWRITFRWENSEMKHVELVKIEDTH